MSDSTVYMSALSSFNDEDRASSTANSFPLRNVELVGAANVHPDVDRASPARNTPSTPKKVLPEDKPKQIKAPAYKPRLLIGLLIYREYDGVKRMGTVIKYNARKKLYKVEYKGIGSEDLERNEVLHSRATQEEYNEYIKRPAGSKKRNNKKGGSSTPISKKRTKTSSPCSTASPTLRKRRNATSSGKGNGVYVPLAYSESKRDEYCYYK